MEILLEALHEDLKDRVRWCINENLSGDAHRKNLYENLLRTIFWTCSLYARLLLLHNVDFEPDLLFSSIATAACAWYFGFLPPALFGPLAGVICLCSRPPS